MGADSRDTGLKLTTLGRVGAPLTVVHPSQNSGRAAFLHLSFA